MKILLSNDDGYDAPGLEVLFDPLKDFAELCVVAPEENNSGAGCSITTNKPMYVTKQKNGFFYVSGRPADCVKLGINEVAPWTPSIGMRGIDLGANRGGELMYSGQGGAVLRAGG